MSRHRAEVRPRYGRIAVLGTSVAVTAVAVLGSVGVLGAGDGEIAQAAVTVARDSAAPASSTPTSSPTRAPGTEPAAEPSREPQPSREREPSSEPTASAPPPLPASSGQGRRVVFSEGEQRVWLVGDDGAVQRTYLVSGSIYDNLDPGVFEVFSRSEQAWGIDDSGTMKYFVRFTQGENAAIGFHDIPVDDGQPLQSVAELGTPTSHGCIRQKSSDAKALWAFAPIGTTVVVTA